MATSAGLTRYSLAGDSWRTYTRADGLPSDQINAIAFDVRGNLYVGTQCDGIAVTSALSNYLRFFSVMGTEGLPSSPKGTGLPANFINDLLVAHDGTVYAATTAGLASSRDHGATWTYIRGRDYVGKVRGRLGGPPSTWKEAPKDVLDQLIPEDYVTCLAEDDIGLIWLGFREQGYAALDPKTNRIIQRGTKQSKHLPDDFVKAVFPAEESSPVFATYGGGLALPTSPPLSARHGKSGGTTSFSSVRDQFPPLPKPAQPPTTDQLNAMLNVIRALPNIRMTAAYLGEDWTTQCDWIGRYGRQYAMLCAARAPWNDEIRSAWVWDGYYGVRAQIGPGYVWPEAIRHWIHWRNTDNPRTLYDPLVGCRRQAEWDDHGEVYPRTREGPNLWITIEAPAGIHRVSLYFFNKDGHDGANRIRDYLVELKPFVERRTDNPIQRKGLTPPFNDGPLEDLVEAEKRPALARARVCDVRGGVNKQFIVRGPGKYLIKVTRNYSLNTVCSAVMIDNLTGTQPEMDDEPMAAMIRTPYRPPAPDVDRASVSPRLQAAMELWKAMDQAWPLERSCLAQRPFRIAAFRAALAENASANLPVNWRWKLLLWQREDREEFQRKIKHGWDEYMKQNPQLRQLGFVE